MSCKIAALSRAESRQSHCEIQGEGMEKLMWKWGWEMLEM